MEEKTAIKNYYDQLASEYDDDRFNNSYGQYLHFQERQILVQRLGHIPKNSILDMGCGTGRFLDFAENGVDFSKGMLGEAQEKFPNHKLTVSDISKMPFENESFEAVYSLHVFMHLDLGTIEKTIQEAHRILKTNGIFIFDFPSKARRKLINYQKEGWHGNTALDVDSIQKLTGDLFEVEGYEGVLLFPIHRVPVALRSFFRTLDAWLCKSFLKKWASYHFVFLRKK
jgi:ubiquinone/menaquinone biosynthesis C-methylase UbiE